MTNLLRQSVYSRLAGYEDVNDAQRLAIDPVMRAVAGKKNASSINTIGHFETEVLTLLNLKGLSEINGRWVERAMKRISGYLPKGIIKKFNCLYIMRG